MKHGSWLNGGSITVLLRSVVELDGEEPFGDVTFPIVFTFFLEPLYFSLF